MSRLEQIVLEHGVPGDEIDRRITHLKMAERLGLNIKDVDDVRAFINAMRYMELHMAEPKLTDKDIAERLGVHPVTVAIWKRKELVPIAAQVVLALYLNDASRDDIRQTMFADLSTDYPNAVRNILDIANGRKLKDGRFPPASAQVDAFNALSSSSLGQAFVNNLFLGDKGAVDEKAHLELRDRLLEQNPVNLDNMVIEGESRVLQSYGKPDAAKVSKPAKADN